MDSVGLVGAGPVGLAAVRALLEDGSVSAIDWIVDPDDARREGARSEFGAIGHANLSDVEAANAGMAILAFSSLIEAVVPVIHRLLSAGYSVVTTCEELAYPPPDVRNELRAAAESSRRVVIATGANPGFVMDRLPLLLAGGCREITEVRVVRRVDTRQRRLPLVAKAGTGLSIEGFAARAAQGEIGHIGLEASVLLMAEGLGWPAEDVEATIEPVVGDDGIVAGQHQVAHLETQRGTLHYELTMSSTVIEPMDEVVIEAVPPILVRFAGGYHGDLGTTARVAAAVRCAARLPAGFYRPTDLPVAG